MQFGASYWHTSSRFGAAGHVSNEKTTKWFNLVQINNFTHQTGSYGHGRNFGYCAKLLFFAAYCYFLRMAYILPRF